MLKYLFLCLLLVAPVSAQELLENGSFSNSPDPQGYPGMEDHAGAYALPILSGSKALPGWSITGKVILDQWKRGSLRTVQMFGSGGIQQTIVTKPSQQYLLRFRATHDDEGDAKQTMTVKIAGRAYPIEVAHGTDPQEIVFTAQTAQTTLGFAGTSPTRGLRIHRLSVTPYDPKIEKTRPIFDRIYRQIMKSMASEPDKIAPLLAPDFVYTAKTGETINAAGFAKLLRKEPPESSFSALFEDIQVGETQVELAVTQKNRHRVNGASVTDSRDFKDVWVKSGNDWLWKSRQEL